jgi:hypothetical protein
MTQHNRSSGQSGIGGLGSGHRSCRSRRHRRCDAVVGSDFGSIVRAIIRLRKQCETISGNVLTVTNIEAQFTTVPDFLAQHAWTFETTTYQCDPRDRPKSECPPEHSTYGTLHRPNPHTTAETVCTAEGAGIGDNRCSGSLRFPLPLAFTSMRWICVEIAVRVNGKWVDNGAGPPDGNRACPGALTAFTRARGSLRVGSSARARRRRSSARSSFRCARARCRSRRTPRRLPTEESP